MSTIVSVLGLVPVVVAVILSVIRLIESINELSKKPELNTLQKCWQIVKNFFTVEKYKV